MTKDEPIKMISKKEEIKLIKELKEDVPYQWIGAADIAWLGNLGLIDLETLPKFHTYPVGSLQSGIGTPLGLGVIGIPCEIDNESELIEKEENEYGKVIYKWLDFPEFTNDLFLWQIFPKGPIEGSFTNNLSTSDYLKERLSRSESDESFLEKLEKKWGKYIK